ncbi:MAG: hypothetical protein M3410_02155 [Acidobacteriota bacterium]|nr:hypothetical protein [Acidobacteriota bacterium]
MTRTKTSSLGREPQESNEDEHQPVLTGGSVLFETSAEFGSGCRLPSQA